MISSTKKILLLFCFLNAVTVMSHAQEMKISGVVRDINSHYELNNVNIYIKGTRVGTTSDIAGRYVLRAPPTSGKLIVVFRHIAYDPLEIPLASLRKKHDVYLQPRVIPLKGAMIETERARLLEIEKDLPQTTSLIEAKDFEIRGYVDAGDLLRTDHSVQVEEELSGKKTVTIRGGNPDEVLVLYNGIKMNSSFDNIFDLSLIDLEDIDRFEIIKGSNTALYGPDAFSGVINIVPKLEPDYHVRFQQRLGTYRSGNWGIHLHHKFRRLSGSYSFKQGGTKRSFADEQPEKQLLRNRSLHHTANIHYRFPSRSDGSPPSSLGAMYIYTSLEHKNHRDSESLSNFNELMSLKYTGKLFQLRDINLSVSLQRLQEEQFLVSRIGFLHRNIANQTFYFSADNRLKLWKLDWLVGYQFRYAALDFTDQRKNFDEQPIGLQSARLERQHHGILSIAKFQSDAGSEFLRTVNIDISFRYDLVRDRESEPVVRDGSSEANAMGSVGIFKATDWHEQMLKLALRFPAYSEKLTLDGYLSFGVNTRFPTLLQQISSPALLTPAVNQPNLNPEKNTSLELSLTIARDLRSERSIYGWQVSGNFFQNYYDNKIRMAALPGFPILFYDTVPDAQISGFETKSTAFLFRKKVALELGLSKYFISEKAAFPFKSDFKRVMNLMVNHAGYAFQLHWFKEGEQAGWIREQPGESGELDTGNLPPFVEVTLPAYSNLDLHLSKKFQIWNFKLFLNLSARNLLKDDSMELQGLTIRDRRFYITLGVQY